MTDSQLTRELDYIERISIDREPAVSVTYHGDVDDAALREAFTALCDARPGLRAEIKQDDERVYFVVPPGHYPEFVTFVGDENSLYEYIKYPNRISSGVARLIHVKSTTSGKVALQINHAVVDGAAILSLFAELWDRYTAVHAGESNFALLGDFGKPGRLPVPPSHLIDDNFSPEERSTIFNSSHIQENVRRTGKYELAKFPILRRTVLSTKDTGNLRQVCRPIGTSVHGALCGSIICALRDFMHPGGPIEMKCTSTINMRNRISPPVAATDTTTFSLTFQTCLVVEEEALPVNVGNRIKEHLQQVVPERLDTECPVTEREFAVPVDGRIKEVLITNPGVIADLRHPSDILFRDFEFLPATGYQLPLKMSYPAYVAYTFDGRLAIDAIFPAHLFTEAEADEIVGRYETYLSEIVQTA